MTIDVKMDHKDTVELFASPHLKFHGYESRGVLVFRAHKRAAKQLKLNNRLYRNLRIDLGQQPGEARLYGITFSSNFGPNIHFTPADIQKRFQGNEYVAGMRLEGEANRGQCLVVQMKGHDQFLELQGPLRVRNDFIGWMLPFVYSFIFYLFITRFQFREYPAFKDIAGKVSSSGANYDALDGMRGLAALTVLAEHTGVFKGSGDVGILWFFCLSGFLLSLPFVREPKRAATFSYMCDFIARRLKRVLPMFYVIVSLLFLFRNRVVDAFRHYAFVQADGVLWTVPQELFFYFWLPFIVLTIYLFFFRGDRADDTGKGREWGWREWGVAAVPFLVVMLFAFRRLPISWTALDYGFWGLFIALVLAAFVPGLGQWGKSLAERMKNSAVKPVVIRATAGMDAALSALRALFRLADKRALAALLLLELTYISFCYLTKDVITLYGNGVKGPPRIGTFLCGTMFAYLGAVVTDAIKAHRNQWAWATARNFSRAGLILYFALLCHAVLPFFARPSWHLPAWLLHYHPIRYPGMFSVLSGILILLAVLAGRSRFSRIVGWLPFRALGVVSFSFYLLHPLVIDLVKMTNKVLCNRVPLSGYALFIIVGILTYILSTITYTWIERPFVRK